MAALVLVAKGEVTEFGAPEDCVVAKLTGPSTENHISAARTFTDRAGEGSPLSGLQPIWKLD